MNPYKILTENLVKEGLQNDVGKDAKLLVWEVKDFTKEGDNYSNTVTSVEVIYEKEGRLNSTSYVAKLNPLRKEEGFTVVTERLLVREMVVLTDVISGMNEQLKKLNLNSIRTPKVYAMCTEKRREAFISEDLRKQGFIMFDRKKGLDRQHGLLVLEELGRFHASSILFEDTLPEKSIHRYFQPYFNKPGNAESQKMFNQLIGSRFENAAQLLRDVPKYQPCVEWLDSHAEHAAKLYKESMEPTEKFNVLTHGDCWNNNLLFRYDDNGHPVELRLVDLQCTKKSSPACDINYLFYTSFNGSARRENFNLSIQAYYESFLEVLLLAGRKPPFSFKELEQEIKQRIIFGCISSIYLLPFVLADEGGVVDFGNLNDGEIDLLKEKQKGAFFRFAKRENEFKERYLMMFDEMLEAKVFDSEKVSKSAKLELINLEKTNSEISR